MYRIVEMDANWVIQYRKDDGSWETVAVRQSVITAAYAVNEMTKTRDAA